MTPGHVLKLQADIIDLLETEGIIDPAGNFVNVPTAKYVDLGAKIVALFTAAGVVLPPNVLKIVNLLPLILQLVESFG